MHSTTLLYLTKVEKVSDVSYRRTAQTRQPTFCLLRSATFSPLVHFPTFSWCITLADTLMYPREIQLCGKEGKHDAMCTSYISLIR